MSEQEEESPPPELPFEILEEILTRLPPKSLLRFTCVSKPFSHLIQNPHFINLHFNKSQETTNCMILKDSFWNIFLVNCNSCNEITKLDPPLINGIQCLTSCNGLLCVEDVKGGICIWNPCINKHMRVDGGNGSTCYREDSGLSYGLGFGYNSVLKDYEIVKVVSGNGDRRHVSALSVYNVRRRVWSDAKMLPYKVAYLREGVYFNGAIHWIALPRVVIAYDLGARKVQEMKLPDLMEVNWINVAVLDECLCLLCDYDSRVEVWVMMQYGFEDSWMMLFADPQLKNYVGVTVKGEFLLQEAGGSLCLYDPRGGSLRDVVTDDTTLYLSLGTRFVESLLPLPESFPSPPCKLCSKRNCIGQGKLSHLCQQISAVPLKVASDDSRSIFLKSLDESDECPSLNELYGSLSEGHDGIHGSQQVEVAESLDKLHGRCISLKDSDGHCSSGEDEHDDVMHVDDCSTSRWRRRDRPRGDN